MNSLYCASWFYVVDILLLLLLLFSHISLCFTTGAKQSEYIIVDNRVIIRNDENTNDNQLLHLVF